MSTKDHGQKELERLVWAAAFANAYAAERKFRSDHPRPHLPIDGISGFSCAELADEALEKFREAMACEDASYLTPVEEGWTKIL